MGGAGIHSCCILRNIQDRLKMEDQHSIAQYLVDPMLVIHIKRSCQFLKYVQFVIANLLIQLKRRLKYSVQEDVHQEEA